MILYASYKFSLLFTRYNHNQQHQQPSSSFYNILITLKVFLVKEISFSLLKCFSILPCFFLNFWYFHTINYSFGVLWILQRPHLWSIFSIEKSDTFHTVSWYYKVKILVLPNHYFFKISRIFYKSSYQTTQNHS